MPVLEIRRRGHRRRVDEPRPRRSDGQTLGLALALHRRPDPRLSPFDDRPWALHHPLLLLNPSPQLTELLLNPRPLAQRRPRQLILRISQAMAQFRAALPPGVPVHDKCFRRLRQPSIKAVAEVDELARTEPERQLGPRVQPHRNDRLLVPQPGDPLRLASRLVTNAVLGHHEQHRRARLDGLDQLTIPVLLPRLHLPHINPRSV